MEALPHTEGFSRREFVARRFSRQRAPTGGSTPTGATPTPCAGRGRLRRGGGPGGASAEELESALGPRTAGVYWVSDGVTPGLQLADVLRLAHAHGVPVLVDASNTLPPPEHLHAFIDLGADLVAFSGGKGLRGPQGSGILTGRADLIRAARMQGAPVQGIGRPMKVSKEEIVGLLTALERWTGLDHEAELRHAHRRTARSWRPSPVSPGCAPSTASPTTWGAPTPRPSCTSTPPPASPQPRCSSASSPATPPWP